jgi:L-amino acid N-acyltransferase YncA
MKSSNKIILRKATFAELPEIWEILQQAIEQRKQDGSQQWQNGYPNEQTIENDIQNGYGHVLLENNVVAAYVAIIFDIEPAYEQIVGKWLSNDKYLVVHRVATANAAKGKGVATQLFQLLENIAIEQNVFSIKVDTNFDNLPMLKILQKLNYTYCGEVFFNNAARKAFEKVLR